MTALRTLLATTVASATLGGCPASTAQAESTTQRAARAVERKVERRYAEGRHAAAWCHGRRTGRKYVCEYGILPNVSDGIRAGEEGRHLHGFVAEGDARVYVEGRYLTVRLLGEPHWRL